MTRISLRLAATTALLPLLWAPAAQASQEWSAFSLGSPSVARTGPVADAQFQALQQEANEPVSAARRWGAAEAKLMQLLTQQQWQQALDWLKEAKPDVNAPEEASGASPLSVACREGQLNLVRELLRHGASVDQIGARGFTPMGAAVFGGHELVVLELLRKGAKVDAPGATGQLPLHLASATGQPRMVALLLKHGADWRAWNGKGRHALAEAAHFGHIPVMTLLHQAGAPWDAADQFGLNALHAAAIGMQPAVIDFLRARGVSSPSLLTDLLIDQVRQGRLVVQTP